MSALLEKAKGHYKQKLGKTPAKLEVPEWDAVVYVKPTLSLQQLGEIMEAANNGKSAEAMVLTVIYRLQDEHGDPVFRKPDKPEILRSVDPDVLARLVTEINAADPSQEDILGN